MGWWATCLPISYNWEVSPTKRGPKKRPITLTRSILLRLTPEQHQFVMAMGGTRWVRLMVATKIVEEKKQ